MFASFFFSLPKWLAFHDKKKVCVIFLFCCPCGLFRDLRGQLGFYLEGIGARLGILWDPSRMGSFGGSLFFLGLWEHPKFRGSLFFGTTLEWIFLKVDPVKSIWVFLNFSFGFHGLMLNRTVDKIQNASRQRNFNLIFLLYKFFELLQLLFSTPV